MPLGGCGAPDDTFIEVGPNTGTYTMDGTYKTVIVNGVGVGLVELPPASNALRGISFTILNKAPGAAIGIGVAGGGFIVESDTEIVFSGIGPLLFMTAGQVWTARTDGSRWYVNY